MYREVWEELKGRQAQMEKEAGLQDMIARLLGKKKSGGNVLGKLLPLLLAGGAGTAMAVSPDARNAVSGAASSVGDMFKNLFGGGGGGGASSGGGGGGLADGIMGRLTGGKRPRSGSPDSTEKGLRNDLRESYGQEDVQGIGDAQSALAAFLGGTKGTSSPNMSGRSKRKLNQEPFSADGAYHKPRGDAGQRAFTPDLERQRGQLVAELSNLFGKSDNPSRPGAVSRIKKLDTTLGNRSSAISRDPQAWASQIRAKEENRLGPTGTKEQGQTINELINMLTGGSKSPRPIKPANALERDPMAWLQSIRGKEENRLGAEGAKNQEQQIQDLINMLTGGGK